MKKLTLLILLISSISTFAYSFLGPSTFSESAGNIIFELLYLGGLLHSLGRQNRTSKAYG
jgi:hypothetical protein